MKKPFTKDDLRKGNLVGRRFFNPNPANPQYEIERCIVSSVGEVKVNVTSSVRRNEILKMDTDSLFPIEASETLLFDLGFEVFAGKVMSTYSINVSKNEMEFKTITLSLEKGNTYVAIRQGSNESPRHEDDLVTVFNSDYHGNLYIHWLQNLYFLLTQEELTFKSNK